jgi:DnaK suppressor protein
MDSATMERYEKTLKSLLESLRSEMNQPVDETQPVLVDGSMGRISRGDAMQVQQLALEMKRRREERIHRVESALMRIRNGTYGLCVRCGDAIESGRLEALPEVVLCVDCASSPR